MSGCYGCDPEDRYFEKALDEYQDELERSNKRVCIVCNMKYPCENETICEKCLDETEGE